MKKAWIFTLLLLSLLTASCTTKYVCPDGSTVSRPDLCSKIEVEKQPQEVLSQDIREVLDKNKNVHSMSYQYKRFDQPLVRAVKVWVKEKQVKQELAVQSTVWHKNEMDVVIFDTEKRTAEAYCESRRLCIKTGDAGPVNFDQYFVKNPLDWVEDLISAEKISEAQIGGRNVWRLRTDTNIDLWTDTFFGVHLRVDVGNERHEFQNIAFNSVADSDIQFSEKIDDLS